MKIVPQERLHVNWIERLPSGMLRYPSIEMHIAFYLVICVTLAVGTFFRIAVSKNVKGSDIIGTREPLLRIVRDLHQEEGDGKAAAELELFATNAYGPFQN